jgi:hypothetical protein
MIIHKWLLIICLSLATGIFQARAQEKSVARQWNEVLLEAIRNDFARPTVHARNLFQVSAAMYDAWTVFETGATPYFLGQEVGGILVPFDGFSFDPASKQDLQREAISYTAYHLINHRFQESPDYSKTKQLLDDLFLELGYDTEFYNNDYTTGSAAALGIYIAEQVKFFGFQDGANERGNYVNLYYSPVNEPLDLFAGGSNIMSDPNRWQPLQFGNEPVIDQSGNVIEGGVIDFLSPEWGNVLPFAMTEEDLSTFQRDGHTYKVYKDPGGPPLLNTDEGMSWDDPYKWGFALVSIWSGQLDPADQVLWDISPAGLGNLGLENLPTEFTAYPAFYDLMEGGDPSEGYTINPVTGQPYASQVVPRGDYARVLAEFWADGPDSETPPGHWFVILNYVMDRPEFVRKLAGQGSVLDPLEYDVKAYFTLGGAMHDAAIAAWSVKGYYDYLRPVSAIRYMASMGQSSNPDAPNYHPAGMPLLEGYIELIQEGDPLAGQDNAHLNQIKLKAWKGHDLIDDPDTDQAGVGWILATRWWPYQRPSFVTPPFAGYVSGHSTYSRAAAEVLTRLTGDEYFPGGMGEFSAPRNEFLVFEEGPSTDVTLQWAKYYDASDQCSLSRIWGGIHPPADDLNGRMMGASIGKEAFDFAISYFNETVVSVERDTNDLQIFPNPATNRLWIRYSGEVMTERLKLTDLTGRLMSVGTARPSPGLIEVDISHLTPGFYLLDLDRQNQYKILINR